MTTYTAKTNTRTLGLFATYMEASAACDTHHAKTGESAWVVTNEAPAAPERTSDFYQDAFTSSSNWGPGEFEKFSADIGVEEDDPKDFFGQRAWRVWDAMTEAQRAEFASDFDAWLDS